MRFEEDKLKAWAVKAQLSLTTYFNERRRLWKEFVALAGRGEYELDDESFVQVRQFLTARNNHIDPTSNLAFTTMVIRLAQANGSHSDAASAAASSEEDRASGPPPAATERKATR